jgi:hypothetical protein
MQMPKRVGFVELHRKLQLVLCDFVLLAGIEIDGNI